MVPARPWGRAGQASIDAEREVFVVDLLVGAVSHDGFQCLVQLALQEVALAHGNIDLVVVEYWVAFEFDRPSRQYSD